MAYTKKPLYQPWNEDDFQADVFVRGMTSVQRWMYRALLQAAFFHNTRPYLPLDDKILWILAGAESKKQWEENKDVVLERFKPVLDHPELIENTHVTEDWNRLMEAREKMSELGQKSAEIRHTFNGRCPPVQQPSNGSLLIVNGEMLREEKVREEKRSEDKVKEVITSANLPCTQEQRKIFNIRYRILVGKSAGGSKRLEADLDKACGVYGFEIVLQCLEEWAEQRKGGKTFTYTYPLQWFFKDDLPTMAETLLAVKEAEEKEKENSQKEQRKTEQEIQAVEESVIAQAKADYEFMAKEPPPENGASVLDYLSDLENSNQ